MCTILLCCHDPILMKNIYGILRDEGYAVDIAEHPTMAIQSILTKKYSVVIFDSEPFGLTAEQAVRIIRSLSPYPPVLLLGATEFPVEAEGLPLPLNLEEFRQTVREIHNLNSTSHPL
jgi:DNA-binding response OmpR family regulator